MHRIQKLQQALLKYPVDAFFVDDLISLLYLTGMHLSAGKLIVSKDFATLLVDGRYFEACKKDETMHVVLDSKDALIQALAFAKKAGFNGESLTYAQFEELKKNIPCELVALDNPVGKLRAIKEPSEIALLKQAADLGSKGYDFALTLIKEGISEEEMALELEIFWRRNGGKKLAFDPIIAFGENSSMPHYRSGSRRLKKGDCILLDIGVNVADYHSDMTRMAFFGPVNPRIQEIYAVVSKAQDEAFLLCKRGTLIPDLDAAARRYIESQGFGEYFTHSLGHGVGMEIHEYPRIRASANLASVPLESGMVITIEPGIYLPGIGGVRIEDTVLITDTGYENLTNRAK